MNRNPPILLKTTYTMKTSEAKQKEWQDFLAKLKATPPEKLSKAARYLLEHEHDAPVEMDMKAVLR